MATIGYFTKSETGYTGSVRTLTVNAKARFAAARRRRTTPPTTASSPAPLEIGAAWKKTSEAGREYLSVKLDDPSFPAPIYASLVETEGDSRPSPSSGPAVRPSDQALIALRLQGGAHPLIAFSQVSTYCPSQVLP